MYFEKPGLLLAGPLLAVLLYYLHVKGYRRFYAKKSSLKNPLAAYAGTGGAEPRRLGTLALKVLLAVLVGVALAGPYIVVEKRVERSGSAELNVSLNVAKPAAVLVVDVSGSMEDSIPGGVKIEVARRAATLLVERMPGGVDVGLLAFSDRIVLSLPPTGDRRRVLDAIESLKPGGGTMYTYPLQAALSWLKPYRLFNASTLVVFVSDGLPADAATYRTLLSEFRSLGIPVYTVYIGPGGDEGERELKLIAGSTGGEEYTAGSAEELLKAFKTLAEKASSILVRASAVGVAGGVVEEKVGLSWAFAVSALIVTLILLYARSRESGVAF